jgi:phenol hydroxylase P5 protein
MAFRLTIEPLGETIDVADGQTVLDACLRSGIAIPYACNHGLCSTCKVEVLAGALDLGDASLFALMDFERSEGKALACCARLESDATIEADVEVDPDALGYPIVDFTGTVVARRELTPDIVGIDISAPEPGIAFQAGQYINLTIPGAQGARAFSIASSPANATRIELQVRRVAGGFATNYLHDELAVGDKLAISGPYGRFFVRTSADVPVIFIAGGSGLSSPKSMVSDLLERGFTKPIYLYHGVRTLADIYDRDYFDALRASHANLHYVPVLSRHDGSDAWPGATGYVHEAVERDLQGSFKNMKAYLCGPPAMIEASIRMLMRGRLFERDIYTEKFVTRSDGEAALARSPLFKRL